jgi:hypothetical protein
MRNVRQDTTQMMMATYAIVESLNRTEEVGHKLFMDNFFSSPNFFDDLHTRGINYCETV